MRSPDKTIIDFVLFDGNRPRGNWGTNENSRLSDVTNWTRDACISKIFSGGFMTFIHPNILKSYMKPI